MGTEILWVPRFYGYRNSTGTTILWIPRFYTAILWIPQFYGYGNSMGTATLWATRLYGSTLWVLRLHGYIDSMGTATLWVPRLYGYHDPVSRHPRGSMFQGTRHPSESKSDPRISFPASESSRRSAFINANLLLLPLPTRVISMFAGSTNGSTNANQIPLLG